MTDKELDKLINNKLNSQTFEYKESYWQQAEILINSQRFEAKKLVWVKSAFYVAVATIFVLMGWFLIDKNKIDVPKIANNAKAELMLLKTENAINNAIKKAPIENLNTNLQSTSFSEKLVNNNISFKTKNLNKNNKVLSDFIKPDFEKDIIVFAAENSKALCLVSTDLLAKRQLQQVAVNLQNPNFDFTQIDFVKLPNIHKNESKKLGYFNASIEVGGNSFNKAFLPNTFGYYVGGRLYFNIGKFSINTNLQYENINQNLDARYIINKTYDFTSTITTNTIKNQSINYAIAGLNLMYPVYRNHTLGIGVQFAQLVKTNDLFTTHNLENDIKENKNTENYSSGINKSDLQFTCNYQFRFAKHLAVNATYVYGLNNVSVLDNKSYNNQGIKLGLQYIIK